MTGLTNEQVQERIAEGKVNVNENPNTRTYKQIILENTLTFFNFLNIALLVLVLFVRSYKNSMFMGIILINTCLLYTSMCIAAVGYFLGILIECYVNPLIIDIILKYIKIF